MSTKLEVTLKAEDVEPRAGDFAIWETEDNEKHIVCVRANDHGRVYFNFQDSDRGDYSSNLTVIGTLITEPQPQQPLRWVENCKPDKPGIWARKTNTANVNIWNYTQQEIDGEKLDYATRCYLGPIPEILPPVKKVVERMWIIRLGTSKWPATYDEQWVPDTQPDPESGDWIRTDRTREVEQ